MPLSLDLDGGALTLSGSRTHMSASEVPDDWRSATLSRLRQWILHADPEAVEERMWVKPTNPDGFPVWSHDGIICTGEIYKNHVKLTFAKGASLEDHSRQSNCSLEGNRHRAIDVHEGEQLDEKAFKDLIRSAVALNQGARHQGFDPAMGDEALLRSNPSGDASPTPERRQGGRGLATLWQLRE